MFALKVRNVRLTKLKPSSAGKALLLSVDKLLLELKKVKFFGLKLTQYGIVFIDIRLSRFI
jgi:hypothetical protein